MDQLKNLCTIKEAQRKLGITYQSTLNLILRGEIEAEKLGWGWAIDKNSLRTHIRQKRRTGIRRARIDKRKRL